jgi:hypothetical protein
MPVPIILVPMIIKQLSRREILPARALNHTLHYTLHDRECAHVARLVGG